jgi:hypothetical protein
MLAHFDFSKILVACHYISLPQKEGSGFLKPLAIKPLKHGIFSRLLFLKLKAITMSDNDFSSIY